MKAITHLRLPTGGSAICKSTARTIYTTANPNGASCSKCRKAAGLGKYNALEALQTIFHVNP